MSLNFETSVIINETTTIKLIELNKKNNDNVFATAIYRHSRDTVTYRWSFPRQMPVKSILVYSVVYIYIHYTWSSISCAKFPKTRVYFGIESFIDNFIEFSRWSRKSLQAGILVQANGTWLTAKLKSTHSVHFLILAMSTKLWDICYH